MSKPTIKNQTKKSIEDLSTIFVQFAENECRNLSKLYYQLSLDISKSDELLKLASHATFRQPMPNLLLGAVHFLLLKSPKERLANFYPSISKKPAAEIPFNLFRNFVLDNRKKILSILKERIVQTNELNRTAHLMPVIASIFDGKDELTLIDIGTSAGLNLNWDKYEYEYGSKGHYGKSSVKIKSEILEGEMPKFNSFPKRIRKIGIDQNPLDLKINDNAMWLKALIWPDQMERFKRLQSAIKFIKSENIELVKAHSTNQFEKIIDRIEHTQPLIIFHTNTIYQFTLLERKELWNMLDRIGKKRDYYYLAVEGIKEMSEKYGIEHGILIELTKYKNKFKEQKLLGVTDGHSNWIKWKNENYTLSK